MCSYSFSYRSKLISIVLLSFFPPPLHSPFNRIECVCCVINFMDFKFEKVINNNESLSHIQWNNNKYSFEQQRRSRLIQFISFHLIRYTHTQIHINYTIHKPIAMVSNRYENVLYIQSKACFFYLHVFKLPISKKLLNIHQVAMR